MTTDHTENLYQDDLENQKSTLADETANVVNVGHLELLEERPHQ